MKKILFIFSIVIAAQLRGAEVSPGIQQVRNELDFINQQLTAQEQTLRIEQEQLFAKKSADHELRLFAKASDLCPSAIDYLTIKVDDYLIFAQHRFDDVVRIYTGPIASGTHKLKAYATLRSVKKNPSLINDQSLLSAEGGVQIEVPLTASKHMFEIRLSDCETLPKFEITSVSETPDFLNATVAPHLVAYMAKAEQRMEQLLRERNVATHLSAPAQYTAIKAFADFKRHEAEAQFKAGQTFEAARSAEMVVQMKINSDPAVVAAMHLLRAKALLTAKRYKESSAAALAYIALSVSEHQEDVDALLEGLGIIEESLRFSSHVSQDAIRQLLSSILALNVSRVRKVEVRLMAARIAARSGLDGFAAAWFHDAIALTADTPTRVEASLSEAQALFRLRRFDDASTRLETLEGLCQQVDAVGLEGCAEAALLRAQLLAKSGSYSKALYKLGPALKQERTKEAALFASILLEQALENPAAALQHAKHLLDSYPNSPRRVRVVWMRDALMARLGDTTGFQSRQAELGGLIAAIRETITTILNPERVPSNNDLEELFKVDHAILPPNNHLSAFKETQQDIEAMEENIAHFDVTAEKHFEDLSQLKLRDKNPLAYLKSVQLREFLSRHLLTGHELMAQVRAHLKETGETILVETLEAAERIRTKGQTRLEQLSARKNEWRLWYPVLLAELEGDEARDLRVKAHAESNPSVTSLKIAGDYLDLLQEEMLLVERHLQNKKPMVDQPIPDGLMDLMRRYSDIASTLVKDIQSEQQESKREAEMQNNTNRTRLTSKELLQRRLAKSKQSLDDWFKEMIPVIRRKMLGDVDIATSKWAQLEAGLEWWKAASYDEEQQHIRKNIKTITGGGP